MTGNSTLIITGRGFGVNGGNSVEVRLAGTPVTWLYEGDGYDFSDSSYTTISAQLGGLAAGNYVIYLRNVYDGNPSTGFAITIN